MTRPFPSLLYAPPRPHLVINWLVLVAGASGPVPGDAANLRGQWAELEPIGPQAKPKGWQM